MKFPAPLSALVCIAMAVIGWELGADPQKKPATAAAGPSKTRSSHGERPGRKRSGPSGEAARSLAAILSTTDPAERLRATIALANSLPSAEFADWLGGSWFSLRDGMEFPVFTGILKERWSREDPQGLLLWCLKSHDRGGIEPAVTAWADAAPQRVLDFFKSRPNDLLRPGDLRSIARKNPEFALQCLREMDAAGTDHEAGPDAEKTLEMLLWRAPPDQINEYASVPLSDDPQDELEDEPDDEPEDVGAMLARDPSSPFPSHTEAGPKTITTPAEWLAAMAGLDSEKAFRSNYLEMLEGWSPEKTAALATGFESLPAEQKKKVAQALGAEEPYRTIPLRGEVLSYAVSHPGEKVFTNGMSEWEINWHVSNHAASLGEEDPEKAGDWVRALPDGDAKFYAAVNLRAVWSVYDPEAAEQWLKSLPAATRAEVEKVAKNK